MHSSIYNAICALPYDFRVNFFHTFTFNSLPCTVLCNSLRSATLTKSANRIIRPRIIGSRLYWLIFLFRFKSDNAHNRQHCSRNKHLTTAVIKVYTECLLLAKLRSLSMFISRFNYKENLMTSFKVDTDDFSV